jgi:hypothetical protein
MKTDDGVPSSTVKEVEGFWSWPKHEGSGGTCGRLLTTGVLGRSMTFWLGQKADEVLHADSRVTHDVEHLV